VPLGDQLQRFKQLSHACAVRVDSFSTLTMPTGITMETKNRGWDKTAERDWPSLIADLSGITMGNEWKIG